MHKNLSHITATLTDEAVNAWIGTSKAPGWAHRDKVLAMRTLVNSSMYQVRSESATEDGVNFQGAELTFSEELQFTHNFVIDVFLLMRFADTPGGTAPHIAYGAKQVLMNVEMTMRQNPTICPPEMVATVRDIFKTRCEPPLAL